MRRILFIMLGVVGALSLAGLLPGPAEADCQCPPLTTKEQMDQATYVFNGDVWDVAFEKPGGKKVITFDVNDSFKGKPKARIEVRDEQAGTDCAIDFHEGEAYLVYASWRWGLTLTSRCWGTKRLDQAAGDAQTLGPGSSAKNKYYDRLQVHCMGRRDTPCCSSSVKAMREGGYLPESDEGCPEDMIPDRLRCDGSYVWCVPTTDQKRRDR